MLQVPPADASALCLAQWERLKRAGMAPGPRASFGMAAHRTRAVLFGGITDQRGKVRWFLTAGIAKSAGAASQHAPRSEPALHPRNPHTGSGSRSMHVMSGAVRVCDEA